MSTNPQAPWSWSRVLLVWSAIAFGILLGGGVALRALEALPGPGPVDLRWGPLLLFSIGGGVTIGLLILTWWLVTRLGFSWTLGFAVLAIVLFALFVWPSPYRYETVRKGECARLKVERWSGKAECLSPARPSR